MIKTKLSIGNKGFTIVEMMIALSVLSTILIMGTVIIVQIGRLYTKGTNAANTQNAARAVLNDVASAMQFSGTQPKACSPGTTDTVCGFTSINYSGSANSEKIYASCINKIRYSFVLNRKQGTDFDDKKTPHVIWRDVMKNGSSCQPLDIAQEKVKADSLSVEAAGSDSKGHDLLGEHMRLSKFRLVETAENSGVYKVEVWTAFGDSDLVKPDGSGCNTIVGSQFCATSLLSVTVTRRI